MEQVLARPEWLPLCPFWREFGQDGPRGISVDQFMTYGPEQINGAEICGWMTYDSIGSFGKPTSYPVSLIDRLRANFGQRAKSVG